MKSIGEKLRTLRGHKTREEVAKAVGISVSALSMYEHDNRVPRDEIKLRLSNFYKADIVKLFFEH